jgi:DNA-binding beta-propeller fold protein YncE
VRQAALASIVMAASLAAVRDKPATPAGRAVVFVDHGVVEPFAIDFDAADRAYIAQMGGNRVSLLDANGRLSVLAGNGEKGLSGDDGPAARARFNGPHHLLVGPDGLLYVADTFNNCVRRIDLRTGIVTRFAGTGEKGFAGDGGPALKAQFDGVFNIAFHGDELYICDLGNRRVRAVAFRSRVVRTVAGSGAKGVPKDGGYALEEPLVDPRAIALDSTGRLYIAERGGHALRVVDAAGRIRTLAGTGEAGDTGDGGPARDARLNGPKHLFAEASGDVLISDTENHKIRRYSPRDGTIATVVGTGRQGHAGLGGPPESCELDRPHGAQVHPRTGELYVSDSENQRVLRIVR